MNFKAQKSYCDSTSLVGKLGGSYRSANITQFIDQNLGLNVNSITSTK